MDTIVPLVRPIVEYHLGKNPEKIRETLAYTTPRLAKFARDNPDIIREMDAKYGGTPSIEDLLEYLFLLIQAKKTYELVTDPDLITLSISVAILLGIITVYRITTWNIAQEKYIEKQKKVMLDLVKKHSTATTKTLNEGTHFDEIRVANKTFDNLKNMITQEQKQKTDGGIPKIPISSKQLGALVTWAFMYYRLHTKTTNIIDKWQHDLYWETSGIATIYTQLIGKINGLMGRFHGKSNKIHLRTGLTNLKKELEEKFGNIANRKPKTDG